MTDAQKELNFILNYVGVPCSSWEEIVKASEAIRTAIECDDRVKEKGAWLLNSILRGELHREKDKAHGLVSALEKASKRSSYFWSDGGQYTEQDWKNEGGIRCAEYILAAFGKVEK